MMKQLIRKFLWRVMGVGYNHILRTVDQVFLYDDPYTRIGVESYSNNAVVYRWSKSPLIIGKYCSISYGVRFILDDGSHTYNSISNYPFNWNKVDVMHSGITVGNDVWIGMNAIILYGVTIGDGATIAAGAVVTKDVPPYTIVGGSPAKVLKEKCNRDIADRMQQIAWWNWDKHLIEARMRDFQLSFEEYVEKYK